MKLKKKASAIFRAYIQFFESLQYSSSNGAFYKLLCFSGSNTVWLLRGFVESYLDIYKNNSKIYSLWKYLFS